MSTTMMANRAYKFNEYYECYSSSFILDGDALTDLNKESVISLRAAFNEVENVGSKAKYGILELNPDVDADVDFVLGADVIRSGDKVSVKSRTEADFDLSIANPDSFSDELAGKVFANENSITLKKDFADASAIWSDDSIEKYNDITMGKILGKLRELSFAITEAQSNKSADLSGIKNADLSGILSQNMNELSCFSNMLDDVLNAQPQSLQELIKSLNESDYSINKNVVISLDGSGNLVIPFDLKREFSPSMRLI